MTRNDVGAALTALSGVLARASNQIATVAVTLVATRYLDPAEFGIFALGSIAITLIRTILYSGAFEYLLKATDARDCSTESLAVNIALAGGLSAVLGVAALAGDRLVGAGAIATIILALLPSNLLAAITAWRESLLLRSHRVRLYYGLTTVAELLAMAAAIALLAGGFKVMALVWQVYVRGLAMLLFYLLADRGIMSRAFSRARFVAILRWSVSRYGSILVGFGANYGADLFLGIFLSPAATGLYRASSRIVTAASDMFAQPARTIGMTIFSARAAAGLRSDAMWPVFFALVAMIGWSALAGLAAIASLLVPLALGEQWRAAAALVPILCLARAFSLFDGIAGAVLVAQDQQRPLFYVQTVTAGITLLLIVIAAPFGMLPATLAVAGGATIASVILASIAFHRMPGSGAALLGILPALVPPIGGTVAGTLGARMAAAGADLGDTAVTALSIAGGVCGWLLALLIVRQRLRAMIGLLRNDAPEPHAALTT